MDKLIKKLTPYVISYIVFSVTGIVFLYFFAYSVSPNYGTGVSDSGYIVLFGKEMLRGRILYRDLVDVKGPVYYFYEALGQFIKYGYTGTFILEIISMILTGLVIILICKKAGLKMRFFPVVMLVFLLLDYVYLWGGNMPEEYILPFNLLAFYVSYDYLQNQKNIRLYSFIIGVIGALNLYSKATMAAPVAGFALVIMLHFITGRKFRELLIASAFAVLGVFTVSLPVFVYFGVNDAISDFIHCAFVLALKRGGNHVQTSGWTSSNTWMCLFIAVFFVLIGGIIYNKHKFSKPYRLLLTAGAFVSIIALQLSAPEAYYFSILLTVIIPAVIYSLKNISEKNRDAASVLYLTAVVVYLFVMIPQFNYITRILNITVHNPSDEQKLKECEEMLSFIPEKDRNSTVAFSSYPVFYNLTDMPMNTKYPVQINRFYGMDKKAVMDYVNDTLSDPGTKYVITLYKTIVESELEEVLDKYFECIDSTPLGNVYRNRNIGGEIKPEYACRYYLNTHGVKLYGNAFKYIYTDNSEEVYSFNNDGSLLYSFTDNNKPENSVTAFMENGEMAVKVQDRVMRNKIEGDPSMALSRIRQRMGSACIFSFTEGEGYKGDNYASSDDINEYIYGRIDENGIYYLLNIDKNTKALKGGYIGTSPESITTPNGLMLDSNKYVASQFMVTKLTEKAVPEWYGE